MTRDDRPAGPAGAAAPVTRRDGTVAPGTEHVVPARGGRAVHLASGQVLTIVNPSGHQVCDFWAFAAGDPGEHLSMAHVHTSLGSICPRPGDTLVSNQRRPMLTLLEDTSLGIHDTLVACCDAARYRELGCAGPHDNCADNLRLSLARLGIEGVGVPAPLNLWMNVPLDRRGRLRWAAPVARPGDRIAFRAEVALIAVMSACPQDMTPINGEGRTPGPVAFTVSAPD